MKFTVLASGSRANCTYIASGNEAILIDCGLSLRQVKARLQSRGLDIGRVSAVLVTHEHSDHIAGLSVLAERYRLPIYASRGTAEHLGMAKQLRPFETGLPFECGRFQIEPFQVSHDAEDPTGFVIRADDAKLVYATDLGRVTPLVRSAVRDANALILESNHDEDLLLACSYPWHIKQRIRSSHGHLSNHAAAALLKETVHPGLSVVALAHISENSNTPEAVLQTVHEDAGTSVLRLCCCTNAYTPTALFSVGAVLARAEVA
jgi:phosphoribosyl 1,2-cyclic phosphodiesterase